MGVCYISTHRLPSGGIIGRITPFEAMHGRKPDLGSMILKADRKKGGD